MREGLNPLRDVERQSESVRDVHHRPERDRRVVADPGRSQQQDREHERDERREKPRQGACVGGVQAALMGHRVVDYGMRYTLRTRRSPTMRQAFRFAFGLALALVASGAAAEPVKFARYPHVSQGKLVFSYHGDIWIANENGSNPVRLTAHVARDTFPRLSPDGKLGSLHQRPVRQRGRVRDSGGRRRTETADVQHRAGHGPELDSRRQRHPRRRRAARSAHGAARFTSSR